MVEVNLVSCKDVNRILARAWLLSAGRKGNLARDRQATVAVGGQRNIAASTEKQKHIS